MRLYRKDDLTGKLATAIANSPPSQIAAFESEVPVLASKEVVLVQPNYDVPLGEKAL